MKNRYQKAELLLPWNLHKKIYNTSIFPYWSDNHLFYMEKTGESIYLIGIDLDLIRKQVILDMNRLADLLSDYYNINIDLYSLPFDKFSMKWSERKLLFSYQEDRWIYDIDSRECTKDSSNDISCLISPCGRKKLYIDSNNLLVSDVDNLSKRQITFDGEKYYDYAKSPDTNTHTITDRIENIKSPPIAVWSIDSIKIFTHKLDQRKVSELHLLQNAPPGSQRPVLHTYKMSFAGEAHISLAKLLVIDVDTGKITYLNIDPIPSPYLTLIEFDWSWWSKDCKKIYFIAESRGSKALTLYEANAESGDVKQLICEMSETYIEPSQFIHWSKQVLILDASQQIIWMSERSGYSHLYLFNQGENIPICQITKGDWCVRELHHYDMTNDWLYFSACGYDVSVDPYYKQLFRCHLDGSDLQCITPENAYHTVSISPDRTCFLDTYSTIDTDPISVLKDMSGNLLDNIARADISWLRKNDWLPPKRLCLLARDGLTPIYGNLYFPSNFDPDTKYPLIDHIYPGPQIYRTSPQFNLYGRIFRSPWIAQAMAELGFIVLQIDGMGTPGRSKAFHDSTYKNISDCGIPDHVTAIQQIANQYDYIDINKIGITGYSGGGYVAVRAMLMYPDFYKVGVAAAGNHDLRCYPASYGEKYNSLDVDLYESQSNAAHANNLQGKLLLIHGELDDNVHPCATIQLVDALIKYNKDFDMLIMPNQNHRSTFDHPYYWRKQWDYFVKHLMMVTPPKDYHFGEIMPPSFPQLKDW